LAAAGRSSGWASSSSESLPLPAEGCAPNFDFLLGAENRQTVSSDENFETVSIRWNANDFGPFINI